MMAKFIYPNPEVYSLKNPLAWAMGAVAVSFVTASAGAELRCFSFGRLVADY